MTWDGYIRISRVGGREGASFISPAVQREAIERMATAKGVELGEVVEEFDVSGAKPIDDRELGRLVRKIETGDSGGILVWRVSRFSRNLLDAVGVAERIREAGGALVGDDLDTTAPMGRAMLGFLAGWAEEERDQRRAGWRAATDRATERGLHLGPVPLGYVRTTIDGKNGPLTFDPDTSRVDAVRFVFRTRASGASWRSIQKELRSRFGVHVSFSGVQQMVAARVYVGEVRRGQQTVNPLAHPPIVNEAQWQAAQVAKGTAPAHSGSVSSQGFLTGLVFCAGCGGSVTTNSNGHGGTSYKCGNRRKVECPAPAAITVDRLDAHVLPGIMERLDQTFDVAAYRQRMTEANQAFSDAEAEMSAFLEHASAADLGEHYAIEVGKRRAAIQDAITRRGELSRYQDEAGLARNLIGKYVPVEPDTWPRLPIATQRDIARAKVERVVIQRSGRGGGRWLPIEQRVVEVVWRETVVQ